MNDNSVVVNLKTVDTEILVNELNKRISQQQQQATSVISSNDMNFARNNDLPLPDSTLTNEDVSIRKMLQTPPLSSTISNEPFVTIVEEPKARGLRFRYKCEGRSAGSIPGESSTNEKKSFPSIKIHNFNGPAAIVVVSCVTKDKPFYPHPHDLVGQDCKDGVCTIKVKAVNNIISFTNIGIQCCKRHDVDGNLKVRERIRVDPFATGYSVNNMDLNSVRLCFQVFLPDVNKKFTKIVTPVISQPIIDKKSIHDLVICRLSQTSGLVTGGEEVFLLCEKINKDDIQVRFFCDRDDSDPWEALGEFSPNDVHRQYAIVLKTPPYENINIINPVTVYIQLRRPSDDEFGEPKSFQYLPIKGSYGLMDKRRRKEISGQVITANNNSGNNNFNSLVNFQFNANQIPKMVLDEDDKDCVFQTESMLVGRSAIINNNYPINSTLANSDIKLRLKKKAEKGLKDRQSSTTNSPDVTNYPNAKNLFIKTETDQWGNNNNHNNSIIKEELKGVNISVASHNYSSPIKVTPVAENLVYNFPQVVQYPLKNENPSMMEHLSPETNASAMKSLNSNLTDNYQYCISDNNKQLTFVQREEHSSSGDTGLYLINSGNQFQQSSNLPGSPSTYLLLNSNLINFDPLKRNPQAISNLNNLSKNCIIQIQNNKPTNSSNIQNNPINSATNLSNSHSKHELSVFQVQNLQANGSMEQKAAAIYDNLQKEQSHSINSSSNAFVNPQNNLLRESNLFKNQDLNIQQNTGNENDYVRNEENRYYDSHCLQETTEIECSNECSNLKEEM